MFTIQKIKFKISKPAKQRGDTILEVVIATAILSTVMVATFNILQRAIDTNLNVKNRVIALNIAREGLEAVRNVRDTNWLKYSGDRRGKWLCHDTLVAPDACDENSSNTNMINDNEDSASGSVKGPYYTIDFSTTANRYYLTEAALQEDIDFLDSGQNAINREGARLYLTAAAPQRYTHTDTGNVETIFYRQIHLDIHNPYDGTGPTFCDETPAEESCTKARLKVISRVYWQEDRRQRSATLEGHLFDFFERDDY